MEGITTARIEYMNGCVQYTVTSKVNKENTEIPSWNLDEEYLEVLFPKKVKVKKKPTGGPTMRAALRH